MFVTFSCSLPFLLASPLDQFGADSFGTDLVDFLSCDFLDSLDVLNLVEIFDSSFLQGVMSSFISTYFYDDDDIKINIGFVLFLEIFFVVQFFKSYTVLYCENFCSLKK
jgi:hypothetical protein